MSQAAQPVPEGFHTLTPHLTVKGGAQAIDFYRRLGAIGMDGWTVQRVSGEALRALADAST